MYRRVVALLMLLSVTFSNVETVNGALRDGEVHHEGAIEAASHAQVATGDHGHEDHEPHGSDHQHGTSSDHCTHQHGPTIPSGCATIEDAVADSFAVTFAEPGPPMDRSREPSFRPPRS